MRRAALVALFFLAAGCRAGTAPVALPSSASPHPSPAPTPIYRSAEDAGRTLDEVEAAIRDPATPDASLPALGRRQQLAYLYLGDDPGLQPRALAQVRASLRPGVQATLDAFAALRELNDGGGPPGDTLPPWRIVDPLPAAQLRGFYAEGEARYRVPWQYLAAINFVETNFGRIVGDSSAGAQGPMQFIQSTWDAYGLGGDVHDPHDAILGAANYLRSSGAPGDMPRAVHAYNPDARYVAFVTKIAGVIAADPRAWLGYLQWRVTWRTSKGRRFLDTGFDNLRPASAKPTP